MPSPFPFPIPTHQINSHHELMKSYFADSLTFTQQRQMLQVGKAAQYTGFTLRETAEASTALSSNPLVKVRIYEL
ncbi:hypothetical protein IQ243_13320 [Nostocales cyanobacterium LEGE 11386]|nr:hypothetical protein [Nostocales cyanobacterium LEGE 11386]